jgi:hypothetical protein
MKNKPRNRMDQEKMVRDMGFPATPLFRSDESREKYAWALKQHRLGSDRKTIRFEKP